MDIRLKGNQYQELMNALLDAYRTPSPLEMMMRFRLDKNLWEYTTGHGMQYIMFTIISNSQAEGWTAKLIAAARSDRPGNDKLRHVAEQFGFSSIEEPQPILERLVARSSQFVDVATFLGRGIEIEAQVCRVEVPIGRGQIVKGTGFLVGPSAVITNYHVMEAVILGEQGKKTAKGLAAKAANVVLRFDYKRTKDGIDIDEGTTYKLATNDWLIDASPPSAVDELVDPGNQLPGDDELDYAILRLDSTVGSHMIGRKTKPGPMDVGAPIRNWISMSARMPDIETDTSVLIMQHPDGRPLKLAIASDAIESINANGTRIRYQISTLSGSSGSPVFNINWELIALHHLGDPNFNEDAKFNYGIPAPAIWATLEKKGKLAALEEAID